MGRRKYEFPSARIEPTPDGLWSIVNDDTGKTLVTGFPSRDAAEQSALDHEFDIVVTGG